MAFASLSLYVCIGASLTETLVSDNIVAFLREDLASIDVGSYAIAIPGSAAESPNYSMERVIRWKLTSEPDNYIQNLKVYGQSDQLDTPNNKVTIYLGVKDSTAGTTPVATVGTYVSSSSSQHDNYNDAVTDYLTITVVPADGKLDTVNEYTDYLYAQMGVLEEATQNQVGTLTLVLAYEEV